MRIKRVFVCLFAVVLLVFSLTSCRKDDRFDSLGIDESCVKIVFKEYQKYYPDLEYEEFAINSKKSRVKDTVEFRYNYLFVTVDSNTYNFVSKIVCYEEVEGGNADIEYIYVNGEWVYNGLWNYRRD